MREIFTKEEFKSNALREIELRKKLISFYECVFLPTLKKFDGKVYNRRFLNAMKKHEKFEAGNTIIHDRNSESIRVEMKPENGFWSESASLYLIVKLDNEWRIQYEQTISDKLGQAWVANQSQEIDQRNDAMQRYDELMEVAKKVDAVIEEFKELPYCFRQNLVFHNTHYLPR